MVCVLLICFFFQAEDGIRDWSVTGVQTLCSSDLPGTVPHRVRSLNLAAIYSVPMLGKDYENQDCAMARALEVVRSEERRVGKECRLWGTLQPYEKYMTDVFSTDDRCIKCRSAQRR